jgi:RimJ/RimL family protein N-acetyltransferase
METQKIQTSRFLLRDFLPSDAPAFLAYHADERFSQFYGPDEASPQHAQQLLATFHEWARQQPRQNYQLAVVHRQEPRALVGCAGLRRAGFPPEQAEVGMELAPDYWGRHAYAVEIGRALLDFGFRQLGLRSITGSTVSANTRIARLAEWFGAESVAVGSGPEWMAGHDWQSVEWHITREQWQRRASNSINDRNASMRCGHVGDTS